MARELSFEPKPLAAQSSDIPVNKSDGSEARQSGGAFGGAQDPQAAGDGEGSAADPSRTYIDGLGFRDMMALQNEITNTCNDALSKLQGTGGRLDRATADALDASLAALAERQLALPVDQSYRQFANLQADEILYMRQAIDASASGSSARQINAYLSLFSQSADSASEALVSAMDVNGMSHQTDSEGRLHYQWHEY